MMRSLQTAALLAGLATLIATFGTEVVAQEFRIEEVNSPQDQLLEIFSMILFTSLNSEMKTDLPAPFGPIRTLRGVSSRSRCLIDLKPSTLSRLSLPTSVMGLESSLAAESRSLLRRCSVA